MPKLPATSADPTTTEDAPAEAEAPEVEPEEAGSRRLRGLGRKLGRRLRPGPRALLLLVFIGLALWMFAPAWSSPTTTTLAGGDGDPTVELTGRGRSRS